MSNKLTKKNLILSALVTFLISVNGIVYIQGFRLTSPDFITQMMVWASVWFVAGLYPFGLGLYVMHQKKHFAYKLIATLLFLLQTLILLMVLGVFISVR